MKNKRQYFDASKYWRVKTLMSKFWRVNILTRQYFGTKLKFSLALKLFNAKHRIELLN